MKTYTEFSLLNDDYPKIYDLLRSFLTEDDIEEGMLWCLGGDVYIIESSEEYQAMLKRLEVFDHINTVPGTDLIQFFLATNNAGGDSYFVPIDIAIGWEELAAAN